jgi:hypothetical protein
MNSRNREREDAEHEQPGHAFDHAGGDGAGRVTLSDAAAAALDVLGRCERELHAIRRRYTLNPGGPADMDPPERAWIDAEAARGRQRTRAVADHLEAVANALRNASDPSGPPFRPGD